MKTKIRKWGNSLAVRIPQPLVKEAHVAYGTPVDLTVEDNRIVIEAEAQPEYSLDELVEEIDAENVHAEVNTGSAVGNDIFLWAVIIVLR